MISILDKIGTGIHFCEERLFEGKIEKAMFLGSLIEYRLLVEAKEIIAQSFSSEVFSEGEKIFTEILTKDCLLLKE